MKRFKALTGLALALALVLGAFPTINAFAEETLTAVEDTESTYVPTQIKNGSFEDEEPYGCEGVATGVDGGWTTTDNWFERSCDPDTYGILEPLDGTFFAEMNADNSGCLYQDLTTYSGDIIRWTLNHAARDCGDEIQKMAVYVGASDGNVPEGVNSDMDIHISAATKATYTAEGVTNPEGKAYGYGTTSELANLAVAQQWSDNAWYTAKGIYIVPEGQTVTRFAFVSLCEDGGCGNLLDNITFSTLLGHLSVTENKDGSVTVKGYWGDTDPAKKLVINLGTEYKVDMTSVCQKNFSVTIPKTLVDAATDMTVYHEDYPVVKQALSSHEHTWTYVANGATLSCYCSNTEDASLCFYQGAEKAVALTVSATGKTYDGNAVVATLSDSKAWAASEAKVPEIEYYQENAGAAATKLTAAPSKPGNYTARITAGEKTAKVAFTISKKTQNAPTTVTGTAPTGDNTKDGFIMGVSDKMEYSSDGGKTWTKYPATTLGMTGLGKENYLIRFYETDYEYASEPVSISFAPMKSLKVNSAPATGDHSHILLYALVLVIAAAGLAAVLLKHKKNA